MDRLTKKFMIRSNPRRSQPARLYGLAKVHKKDTPLRLVLSLPRSAYHKIAVQVTLLLSVVDDCQINSSTKCIADILKSIQLDDDEVTQGGGGSPYKSCVYYVWRKIVNIGPVFQKRRGTASTTLRLQFVYPFGR